MIVRTRLQPLINLIPQRHIADCGVTCLAMFLGVTYEDALLAFDDGSRVIRSGVWFPDLRRAAAKLGIPTRVKRAPDIELDEGILKVEFRRGETHVVVLREGILFDTDFSVWRPEDYCAAKRAKLGALLIRED